MRKNNVSRNKDRSVTKSDDIRQQIASDGIINAQALKGNGNYSIMSDGTAFVNDDSANAFEKHEEALLAEHNAAVDEKIIEWTNKYEEMTELVKFDVEKIEFLYRQKYITTDEGYIDVDNGAPYEAVPAWKFTLFNPNDNKYYATYVYAESGEFDYFTYTEYTEG